MTPNLHAEYVIAERAVNTVSLLCEGKTLGAYALLLLGVGRERHRPVPTGMAYPPASMFAVGEILAALSAAAAASALAASPATDATAGASAPQPPQIQYGVALTIEQVVGAGPLCVAPCILTSGGGISMRAGQRSRGPLYWGLAYELSKQGSNNIYRLGILQQVRAEGRYYIETGRVTVPFVQFAAGAAGYGNEWGVETLGPLVSTGVGAQFQIARDTVVGLGIAYRALWLSSFTDSAGLVRGGGIASLVGFDLQLEGLDIWPFSTPSNSTAWAR